MPNLKQKNSRFPKLVQRLGRRNLGVVVAFVLVFAGVGTFYVQRSLADTGVGECVYFTLYQYRSGFYGSHCVRDIQYMLQKRGYGIGIDGIYGPQTASVVKAFGIDHGINNSSQVGSRTWHLLCSGAYSGWYATPWAANDVGCYQQDKSNFPWGHL